jgi:PAS domain S-box-containing protein
MTPREKSGKAKESKTAPVSTAPEVHGGTGDVKPVVPVIGIGVSDTGENISEVRREEALLKVGVLQNAIFNSANFSSIITDANGVIQFFNVGADRLLGYTAGEVVNKITPADISDPQDLIARAKSLSAELGTPIAPGFDALVFKASRGIEDIYELTYISKDGSRIPAVVSVTALRDAQDAIIGYLLIGTNNTARKKALLKAEALQRAIFNSANFSSIATDAKGIIQIFNVGAERMLGYSADEVVDKKTPAELSDPQELIARAKSLGVELGTPIAPGFDALVFKASRGIEDIYELTYIRKDGGRFPAVVSVTALRNVQGVIIGYLLIGTDNTARKQAEDAREQAITEWRKVEEQARYLARIVQSSEDAIIGKSLDGVITSWNRGAEKIYGYTEEEIVGQSLSTLIPPELRDETFQILDRINTGESTELQETTRVRKDGKMIHVSLTVSPIMDPSEKIIGASTIARDITERKRSEEHVARLHQQNELILSSAAEGILGLDLQGKHTFLNPAAARMLGYEVEELLGRPSHSTWHHTKPDGSPYPEEECQVCAAFRNGVAHRVSNEVFWSKDGTSFPVEYVSTPIYEQGRLAGAVLTFADITERKHSDRTVKESEEKFRAIFENSKDGIVLVDVDSKKFHLCNNTFCHMVQYTFDEITQLGIMDIHPEEDFSWIIEEFDRRGRHEPEKYMDIPVKRKDGSIFWADIKSSPVTISGKNFVLGNFRDITELRLLENQLRTSQKMEAVGTLAGGIAHDFNNTLTGIVGYGELLRRRLAGDEKALHDLDEILRCAERAATLTRQLLTFARRQVIEPINLNLSTLVADLMKLIGKVVSENIEIRTSLEKNAPTIHADRGQIEQVLMNLCLNARDAMPEGGRLVVETEDVSLDEEYVRLNPYMKAGRYALLTVSDTGVGMDEKTRERVFEPFFTTKGPDKGTGLGLAMVYGIVKQHGGFIHLYSEPGEGTVFKVYFPAIEAQPDSIPEKRREEIVHGGTETILLADDEEAICAIAERVLTGFGYKVLVARNGEEATDIFRQHKEIVLAILDVVMPRKGGKEAFEEMRKQNPLLKVIFMSGYSIDAIHDTFVLIAGTPFLQKPFGPTLLARKVREVLDKK